MKHSELRHQPRHVNPRIQVERRKNMAELGKELKKYIKRNVESIHVACPGGSPYRPVF